MKLKGKLIILVVAVVVVVGVFAIDTDLPIGNNNFTISPPQTLAFQNIPIPDINCSYQTILYVIDSRGLTVSFTPSSIQSGNPLFAVVDVATGKNTAGDVIIPTLTCTSPATRDGGLTFKAISSAINVKWELRSGSRR